MNNNSIIRIDEDTFLYYGYQVYRNGMVISPNGKILNSFFFNRDNSHINMYLDTDGTGKRKIKKVCKSRLIYKLFSEIDEIPSNMVLVFKDGNDANCDYSNLELISRKQFCKGKNPSRRKLSDSQIQAIKDARSGVAPKSIRALCKQYGCSISTIQKAQKAVLEKRKM